MYEQNGKGLVHGFQKDSIQNALGAKVNKDYSGWKCEINLTKTKLGTFITVRDSGTFGLSGPNLSVSEINKKIESEESFPEEWRLVRISCFNESGNLSTGAGLFGIGKTMYSAASQNCKYIFESLTIDGTYLCNINDNNKMFDKALTGDIARKYISENTGLEPITIIGTRFIIFNPKDNVLEAILNGQMLRNAEETWWRVIPFLKGEEGIYINNTKVMIPRLYLEDNYIPERYKIIEKSIGVFDGFRTKKHGFFICKEMTEDLEGFYFYRKGMKIGELKINIPELENNKIKCFGFIEVQDDWELQLAAMEYETHYDVKKEKKNNKFYQELRNFVSNEVKSFLVEWGYINSLESKDKKINSLVETIKDEIQNFFKDEGFEEIGKGGKKEAISYRLKEIEFPNKDENRTVYDDQLITFKVYIKNTDSKNLRTNYKVYTQDPNKNILEEFFNEEVELAPNSVHISKTISIRINEKSALKYSENNIIVLLTSKNSKKSHVKKITFYYAIPTVKNPLKDYEFDIATKNFPRILDRRINSGEKLSDITYSITNNTDMRTVMKLSVNTHNVENSRLMLENVKTEIIEIDAFQTIETSPFSILFGELYDKKMKKGPIEINAKIVIFEGNKLYEKGEIIGEYKFIIFYNMNEKNGFEDSFENRIEYNPNDHRRSHSVKEGQVWFIVINAAHPEYKLVTDGNGEFERHYLEKLIIREFINIYIKEEKFSSIGLLSDPDGTKSSVLDIIESINSKIEDLWWKRCQII